jgi:hypothetical protein
MPECLAASMIDVGLLSKAEVRVTGCSIERATHRDSHPEFICVTHHNLADLRRSQAVSSITFRPHAASGLRPE